MTKEEVLRASHLPVEIIETVYSLEDVVLILLVKSFFECRRIDSTFLTTHEVNIAGYDKRYTKEVTQYVGSIPSYISIDVSLFRQATQWSIYFRPQTETRLDIFLKYFYV